MTTYKGTAPYKVERDGLPLDPRHDLTSHSPDGFSWGYEGSGPSQLALAILADHLGPELAMKHYQQFKRDIIAGIPGGKDWLFDSALIDQWASDNGLLELPVPEVAEIIELLYAACQSLKVAGTAMSRRIEADAELWKKPSSAHPRAKELALVIVCTGRLEQVIESMDVTMTDPATRCAICGEHGQADIPYRLCIEGDWQTADICAKCFDKEKKGGHA